MHDDQDDVDPAHAELCKRLKEGRARSRTNVTDLARKATLGRTTVSEAFNVHAAVPSLATVATLARAMKLPVGEMLELQRKAVQGGGYPALGRLIGEWEPHALEVHPAGSNSLAAAQDASGVRVLPGYVERGHDRVLAEAVRDVSVGRSRIVVLVGSSSTGKTRACWQAVQPLKKEGWRLWHPFEPTRAEAALAGLPRVAPCTVVWLNEAQQYLGDREAGETIAAALHSLLTAPERGPVLVLGTLWSEYAVRYSALPRPGGEDPHSRARELLSGRTLTVPDAFDSQALAEATALAQGGDRLLADALTRASADGRVTQDLAGAPELLNRYERATPAARAVLEAAMDARRLGVGLHLPQSFLTAAAADYLSDIDYDQLTDDWAERAYSELAEPVHGKQPALRSISPRPLRRPPVPLSRADAEPALAVPMVRLADYLEQHGRAIRKNLCPPASFWHAAHTQLRDRDDLNNLAEAAKERHRLQWARYLLHRAATMGSSAALVAVARMQRDAGDREGAETTYRLAVEAGRVDALNELALMREGAGDRAGAEAAFRQEVDAGCEHAPLHLAMFLERWGDREAAESLARQAAVGGDPQVLLSLARARETEGDLGSAEVLARQAADAGATNAWGTLAQIRDLAGDGQGAEELARQAEHAGFHGTLLDLAEIRERKGKREEADDLVARIETIARQEGGPRNAHTLLRLAWRQKKSGDRMGAEELAREAANRGSVEALIEIARMRQEAGDREGAEAAYQEAVEAGRTYFLTNIARMREEAGDLDGAEAAYLQAVNGGVTSALLGLGQMREKAGNLKGAEVAYRQAMEEGDSELLLDLAELRSLTEGMETARAVIRQAADSARVFPRVDDLFLEGRDWLRAECLWPNGLDPDGTPTPPWE
ncbi:tetratricopeptide repeat protein [Streptomyces sasae]|uniref:tetratricopeptide repeat protein n=1 Tax=Streptomyces sasae TaxID=1266772 RepID=UPI0029306398|nr:hypothetical protein [Streptomyces sasae]